MGGRPRYRRWSQGLMSPPAGLGSQVSCPRAHARIASGGCARGEADEPVRKPLVRAVFAVMRRQDGGSPCGGSRTISGRLGEASDRNHKSPVWRQSMSMRYEQKTLFNRLRNQHPVKRIVVVQGQRRHPLGMIKTNRKFHNSRVPTEPNQLLRRNRDLSWPD